MTAKGKIVFTLLLLAVVGFGAWRWRDKLMPQRAVTMHNTPGATAPAADNATPAPAAKAQAKEVAETLTETPKLPAPLAYQPKNNVVDVELSEYAGYAGF